MKTKVTTPALPIAPDTFMAAKSEITSPVQFFQWMQSQPVKHRLGAPIKQFFYPESSRLHGNALTTAMRASEVMEFFAKYCRGRKKLPTFFRTPERLRVATPAMEKIYTMLVNRGALQATDPALYDWQQKAVDDRGAVWRMSDPITLASTLSGNVQLLLRIMGQLYTEAYLGIDTFRETDPIGLEGLVMAESNPTTPTAIMGFCERLSRNKRNGETHTDGIRNYLYFSDLNHAKPFLRNPY